MPNKGWFTTNDPRRARGGGKKGRSGRKPDAWRRLCGRLVNRASTIRAAKRIVQNPDHPAWLGAVKFLAAECYGRPREAIEAKVGVTLEELVTRARREGAE